MRRMRLREQASERANASLTIICTNGNGIEWRGNGKTSKTLRASVIV